jgi:hypothetical protein
MGVNSSHDGEAFYPIQVAIASKMIFAHPIQKPGMGKGGTIKFYAGG